MSAAQPHAPVFASPLQPTLMERLRATLLQGAMAAPATAGAFQAVLDAARLERPSANPGGVASAWRSAWETTGAARFGAPIRPILQTDPKEYATAEEARRWGASSCSAASLAAVLRAAGRPVRVGDVVRTLESAGGITVAQGLVSRAALASTARRFGLDAADRPLSYNQLAVAARRGPVLVDVTSARFPQGHWLVVTGVDAGGVSVADSSGYRLTRLSRAELLSTWSGRGVLLAPPTAGAPITAGGSA